ncbi:MAG: tRNA 2-thiouridine(34) synthase MnmA [Negativibacillus massiliensis]|jgi:tRNA-specific 2-thiouridylase|uniref:tRNA 2-thiouridine(34) synthase MnmA n=1 Tax=Negativibacillus massiliensis TaxID=1871035 RepID=UPI0039A1752C
MSTKKVLVALSGGVDSSVAVHLLRQQGYEVEGIILEFSPVHKAAVQAAQVIADQLDVKLHVVECHKEFEQNVILPFCREYQAGRTPNPCIFCNPTTKFGIICQFAKEHGFDKIATGHYARVEHLEDGTAVLKKSACIERDQSYMLYRLTQEQLSMLILPLEGLEKTEVRQIARDLGLASADAPDSQEICWLPDGDYASFIEQKLGKSKSGDFISPDGTVCGKHKGLLHYTVGQRKRLGIALGYPVFIKEIDPELNRIYLARTGEEYADGVLLTDCVIQPNPLLSKDNPIAHANVKVRSRASDAPATITLLEDGTAKVVFDTPQRAPAPGQSCVIYDGITVLGGGYISKQLEL